MAQNSFNSGQRNTRGSRSNTAGQPGGTDRDAELLAQFAAAAGSGIGSGSGYPPVMPPTQYTNMGPAPGFYGNFFHHDSMSQSGTMPTSPPLAYPWGTHVPSQPQHQANLSQYLPPQQVPSGSTTTFIPDYHSPQYMPEDPPSPTTPSISAEEKRRRNTAASARFRIKKKQTTINLERTVSDLTGRAEELEREAGDLRRENGWLKEIVMLKGARFAATNEAHRAALAAAAGITQGQDGNSTSAGEGSYSSTQNEDSQDQEAAASDKESPPGKGKGRAGSSRR